MERNRPRHIEIAVQRELLKWIKLTYPELEVVWIRNEGDKAIISAVLDEMSGIVPGFPDLIIFKQVRSITHILHLELKKKKGMLSTSQKEWHAKFVPSGNRKLATGYGLIHSQEIITKWTEELK